MVDTDNTRRMTYDRQPTMPGVWHKLPTGELTILIISGSYGGHRQHKTHDV